MAQPELIEAALKDLKSRVLQLEKTNDVDLIIDEVMETIAKKYNPRFTKIETEFKAYQQEIKTYQQEIDQDIEQLRQQTDTLNNVEESIPTQKGPEIQTDRLMSLIESLKLTLTHLQRATTDRFEIMEKSIESNVNKLNSSIAYNPLNTKVDNIESKMQNFVTIERFRALQDNLIGYATNDTVEQIMAKISKLDSIYLSKTEFMIRNDDIHFKTDQKLLLKVDIVKLNTLLAESQQDSIDQNDQMQKMLDLLRKTIKKLQKDFKEVIEVTNSQSELLLGKVDFSEIDKIWDNFDKFCIFDDLKDLYLKTVPEISKFETKIIDFQEELDKQAEILRRFDEVILDKVSKGKIRELASAIDKKYAPAEDYRETKRSTNEKLAQNDSKLEMLQDTIDVLGKSISKDIFAAVKRATFHLNSKAGQQSGATTEEISQATDELKQIVSQKADKQLIFDLGLQKANKIDTQLAMRWIEVLNRQLKQIIVLVTEMLRVEVIQREMKSFEGEQHVQTTKAFLFQQALLVAQWVNRFQTQSVNEYFLESSNGVSDLNWTPPEVQAFQKYAEDQLSKIELEVLSTRNQALAQSLKMRSKSVLHGGNRNLAKTQVNFTSQMNTPRKDNQQQNTSTAILNNKIHYGSSLKTPQSIKASMIDFNTGDKEPHFNGKLNSEGESHQFNNQSNNAIQVAGTSPALISQYLKQKAQSNFSFQTVKRGGGESGLSFLGEGVSERLKHLPGILKRKQ